MHIPLGHLRTFAAAARHESFARAAEDLNVTPAAVSQQIRQLEDRLQVPLFVRRHRQLKLTRRGREYARKVAEAIERIEDATRTIATPPATGILRIGTFASFAMGWLLPRLPDFSARYPDIRPDLVLSANLATFDDGEIDLAIRFGAGNYPGCDASALLDEAAIVVCSPALLALHAMPRRHADIARFPLLHDQGLAADETRLTWPHWLGPSYDEVPAQRRIQLPDGVFTLQAALLGQGAAIVRRSIAHDHLLSGRLVKLSNEEEPTEFRHWFVTPAGQKDPRVQIFRDWIYDMAAQA